ncbi:MAG: hypothetical protein QOG52_1866 [Frankiaceae bacterium]|jgi:undecaprenyl-diphosphatase|nr:hypothetical protein [Frankiaceae bacterium]
MRWVAQHRFAAANGFARNVMELSNDRLAWGLAAFACGAYIVVARRYRLAVAVVGGVVVAFAASVILKDVLQISRPKPSLALVYADGWSFPSTDATITAAAASSVFFGLTWLSAQVRRRLAWTLGVLLVVVGALLMYVGAHWLTDVVAGWILGGAIGVGAARLTQR